MKLLLLCFLSFSPVAVLSQDFLSQFPCHQKTEFFDFYCKSNSPEITNIERFADGFIKVIDRDFFKAAFDYPIRVLVFEDKPTYMAFLSRELHIPDPPGFGIYLGQYKLLATYPGSGLGTFAHEILHPLIEADLKERPSWAKEGIPTFFEKFYGYWKDDHLVVYWGYQNPWRIQALGTNLNHLDLKSVISDPEPTTLYSVIGRNESKWRMASMFLWEQGRFKRFLKLIIAHDLAGYPTYFEAALEKPINEIVPVWQKYLNEVSARQRAIMSLPPSKIFENEADFRDFAQTSIIGIEFQQAQD